MQSESNDNWIIFFDIRNSFFEFFDIAENLRKNSSAFVSNFAIDSKMRNRFFFLIHSLHRFIDSKSIFFIDEKFLSMKTSLIDSKIKLSYSAKNVRNWLNFDLKFEISLIVFVDLSTIFEFEFSEKLFSESAESIDLAIFLSIKKNRFFF